jgi:subtilase family serine protease
MSIYTHFRSICGVLALLSAFIGGSAEGSDWKILPGHVPHAVANLTALGRVPATNAVRLAVGVPLRDSAGLESFLVSLYDPASPNYRQYLSPEQFAARFSPTEQDYEAVKQFARANGLTIVGTHSNRLVLDVVGPAAAVETALHVRLQMYQHPTEGRQFFAPDTDPTVAADLPVADVQGLSDYSKPHPKLKKLDAMRALPRDGSAPDGSGAYFGNDFRNAYAAGTTLTGAGQSVGLLEFDGYYASDISSYAAAAGGGRANIVIQPVLLDGYNGVPTSGLNSGNGEVSLDIEMAMAMAPGLAKIVVFEGGPNGLQNDVLNAMVANSSVKSLACCWGWSDGPNTTTDNIFKQMATQGQSFLNASGDGDAFTVGATSANGVDNVNLANAPSSSPYITQVGGTTLTMNGSGSSYGSETVWNWGGGSGSSGGVSSYYAIPTWQAGISMSANQGSTTQRNIPDVAMIADNVFVYDSDGSADVFGGTSCAAPLWAGFLALVNQQATSLGNPAPGLINSAIYAIGKGQNQNFSYAACFHDVTSGNNFWTSSPTKYVAVAGYDLCTGWGTPGGVNLINALAGQAVAPAISALGDLAFGGVVGGPFAPASASLALTNASSSVISWSLASTSTWLKVQAPSGSLGGFAATNLNVSLTAAANVLNAGTYASALSLTNLGKHVGQKIQVTLQVIPALSISSVQGFTAFGPVGGPFTPNSSSFVISNASTKAVTWRALNTTMWLSLSASSGTIAPGGQSMVTVGISTAAKSLRAAVYKGNIIFTSPAGTLATVPFTLSVGQPLVQNGGFENGNFSDWTQSGNTGYTEVTGNTLYLHSGRYGAELGPAGAPGYLSQTVNTLPGQMYRLSFWVRNPSGATPNWMQVQWNGTTVFEQSDIASTGWTNLQVLVTASSSASVLQFGFQDDPAYLGLDDVSLLAVATPLVQSTSQEKTLSGHVPEVVSQLSPIGRVPATSQLHLAIGLPLRDSAGLDEFLAQLYDPASPNYRQYLTPVELAARFGPTEPDYEAVKEFARTNGLTVAATFSNRLVLDVVGPAAAVEKALHITLRTYQHPTEARQFFAPDTEPTVAAGLPVADIQGLSDYYRPRPHIRQMDAATLRHKNGTAPDGTGAYFGNDFRNAYAPGTTLTGAGQMVGILEFDGFYASDIADYAAAAGGGRSSIPIQTVLLDGYNGVPTTGANSGNTEVSLDIEMAMAIAPGLANIVMFEAGPYGSPNDVLNSMLSYSNTVKQLSSSWGWGGGPSTTTDAIFKNMEGAGQSFFNAAGDSDAFTTGSHTANGVDNTRLDNAPSSSPYITQVGGTTLTMNGAGSSYASETVWNWGVEYGSSYNGIGTSGGISSSNGIPSWQTNVANLAGRGGSASARNIPDVALTADNIYVVSGGSGGGGEVGGTSCAAPLWAGFIALANQQAAANGRPSVGFINPAIYAIAASANYSACFNDVTTGNNTWSSSPSLFYATNGYDLCTGLGTPNGTNLISALVSPAGALIGSTNSLGVLLGSGGNAFSGPSGGPFTPGSGAFVLTNSSAAALNWSLINTSLWLNASSSGGSLAAHGGGNVSVSISAAANSLAVGNYAATVVFSNQTSQAVMGFPFTLQVYQPISLSSSKGFTAVGPVGGPFNPSTQTFVLTNQSGTTQNWSLANTTAWLTTSTSGGSLGAGAVVSITAGLSSSAESLAAGVYNGTLTFSDAGGVFAVVTYTLSVGQPIVQNGGFETGDFTGWTQSGNTEYTLVTNLSSYVYSGTFGAVLGPAGSPGYLSQNLTTVAGQTYVLSLWLQNPTGTTPNEFQVQWNGTTIFSQANITTTTWTNLQFFVTPTGSSTPLQFGFEDQPAYLALDAVSVNPLAPISFNSLARSAGNLQLSWGTTTGLVYQVQYKTNLVQANWLNLGAAVTANSSTLTVADTNAVPSSPQRFYRLLVVP